MRLPKIQEDECPLKNTYFNSIAAKPLKKYKTDKLIFDWQSAQVQLISRIPDQDNVLQPLIQLQNICKEQEIPNFYSYFFVNRLLFQLQQPIAQEQAERKPNATQLIPRRSEMIKKINLQIQELKSKKSRWSKIIQLILLRQNLVSKINGQVANNKLEIVYSHLDDIRFINFQIIKKINQWSNLYATNSEIRPFFLYQGKNYPIKMINDNTNVINALNQKAIKFLSPPNPFYLTRDGNKTSMSVTQQNQIDNSMEYLAKQKAQQLKMILNPPKFVTQAKNDPNQLKKLKNQLQQDRIQRIKNVYKSSAPFTSSMTSLRLSIYSGQKNKQKQVQNTIKPQTSRKTPYQSITKWQKNEPDPIKRNKFEKLIQQKQVEVIQQLKSSQVKLNKQPIKSTKKDSKNVNKYISRVQSLRRSIENNNSAKNNPTNLKLQAINAQNQNAQTKAENLMRISTISNKSNQLPKTVAEIKAPKPKIKLIMEKQSIVQDVVRAFLPTRDMQVYKSRQVRKTTSSFFKASQKQVLQQKKKQRQENKQAGIIDIKPVTQYNRTLSASNITQQRFSNSKTRNSFLNNNSKSKIKKEDKSKSKSLSKSGILSQLQSPHKRQKIDEQTKLNLQSQSDLRAVNSKLRQLTIMSIYGKKMKSVGSIHNPYESNVTKVPKTNNKQQQKDRIDAQLRAVKNRLNQLSTKKIYDRKLNTKNFNTTKSSQLNPKNQKKLNNLVQREQVVKKQNQNKQQQIQNKKKQRQSLLQKLLQKDKRIQQLLKQMQKQEKMTEQKNKQSQQISKQQQILRLQRENKLRQIQALKQKIKSQNRLIKQQMENQERKYLELKQKQFEIKQEQMSKKYEIDMQQMKQEYMKKNQQLELKIIQQEKRRKQNELKLMQQQRQMEQLKSQMEQKRLKQQILEQILREQKAKDELQQKITIQDEQFRKQRMKRQILQKQQMQRKVLENFEQQNKKLIQMFELIKRKNEAAEKQNQMKLLQLKRIEEEAKIQEENLMKLQTQLMEARNKLEKQHNQQRQAQVRSKQEDQDKQALQQEQNIEQVKLKVKEQILRQMMLKRREEQQQLKIEKQQRNRKLAEIQEEIRKQLKKQEQQMQKIQRQQRQKYQKVKRQIQQQHQRQMKMLQKDIDDKHKSNQNIDGVKDKGEQGVVDEKAKQNQNQEEQDNNEISKQEYEKQLKKAIENAKIQAESRKKQQQQILKRQQQTRIRQEKQEQERRAHQEQQKKKKQDQQQQKKKIHDQKQKIRANEVETNNKLQQEKQKEPKIQIQNRQDNTKKQQSQPVNKTQAIKPIQHLKESELVNKNEQGKKVGQDKKAELKKQPTTQTQTVKQPSQQILTKYQNLQQYLSKCKQIYIDDKATIQFVSTFFGQFAIEVKQMLPYSSDQILKLMINTQKKVDIFECPTGHSVGWLDQDKYVLIGQISCIENIVRKYGQIQIQMTYIFNKTNPYQKQYLAKQIKIFDKIGYIFQKKLKEQNMFSIKLIIKVPAQILPKNFKTPKHQLEIQQKMSVDLITQPTDILQNKLYSYEYLLSQTLKNCLTAEQQLQIKQDKTQQSRFICDKMHYKLYNDNVFKSTEIDDKRIKVQVNLGLRYIQTHDFPCYVVSGAQYVNRTSSKDGGANNAQKLYIANVSKNISIVVFPHSKSYDQFSLDILLNINVKTGKMDKQRQLLLCIPVWRKSQQLKLNKPGPKQFTFTNIVQANLNYGSIITTNVFKQQYKFMEAPFVFALYQTNDNGLPLRPLLGQIVQQKDLVKQKR